MSKQGHVSHLEIYRSILVLYKEYTNKSKCKGRESEAERLKERGTEMERYKKDEQDRGTRREKETQTDSIST